MPGRLHLLTDRDVAEIRRLLCKVDGINGPGVTNAPDSVSIAPVNVPPPQPQPAPAPANQAVFARILADGSEAGLYRGESLDRSTIYGLGADEIGELREAQGQVGIEADTLVEVQASFEEDGVTRWMFTFQRPLPPGGLPGEHLLIGANSTPYWSLLHAVGGPV